MAVAEAVLNSPDYFRCEKQRCRLRKAACVALQEKVKDARYSETHPCRSCAQGEEIKTEFEQLAHRPESEDRKPRGQADARVGTEARKTQTPSPGAGEQLEVNAAIARVTSNPGPTVSLTDDDLIHGAGVSQPSGAFSAATVSPCAQGRKIKAEIGGTAILVVQHGRDAHVTSGAGRQATSAIEAPAAPGPTVSPCALCGNPRARNTTYGRLCHSCHSKQMYADGTSRHQGKTNPDVYRHTDDPGKTVSKPEDVPQANVLVLNFKDYPELYRELQERAEADYRNLDQEVFYALDVVFKPSDHLEAKEKT